MGCGAVRRVHSFFPYNVTDTAPRLLASLVAGVTDPATAEGGDDRVDDRAPAYVAISRHRFGDLGPEPETFG